MTETMKLSRIVTTTTAAILAALFPSSSARAESAKAAIEEVASFPKQQVTGMAVSKTGRIFVNFPFWSDDHTTSVAEVMKDGSLRPYPDEAWNRKDGPPAARWVCVQSVYIDQNDTLWVLDPAAPKMGSLVKGGPKLVRVDLASNKPVQTILFEEEFAPEGSYLNDVRVDTKTSHAFLTESGLGALLVVDLQSGKKRRLLAAHPATKAEPDVQLTVAGIIALFFDDLRIAGRATGPRAQPLPAHRDPAAARRGSRSRRGHPQPDLPRVRPALAVDGARHLLERPGRRPPLAARRATGPRRGVRPGCRGGRPGHLGRGGPPAPARTPARQRCCSPPPDHDPGSGNDGAETTTPSSCGSGSAASRRPWRCGTSAAPAAPRRSTGRRWPTSRSPCPWFRPASSGSPARVAGCSRWPGRWWPSSRAGTARGTWSWCCSPPNPARDWAWVRWLPHLRAGADGEGRRVGLDAGQLRARIDELVTVLDARTELRAAAVEQRWSGPSTVVVLDGAGALRRQPGVARLLEEGPAVGIRMVCLERDLVSLPVECRVTVVVTGPVGTRLRVVGPDATTYDDVVADGVGDRWAQRFARALAPLRDATPDGHESALPAASRLLDLLPFDATDPTSVETAWRVLPAQHPRAARRRCGRRTVRGRPGSRRPARPGRRDDRLGQVRAACRPWSPAWRWPTGRT